MESNSPKSTNDSLDPLSALALELKLMITSELSVATKTSLALTTKTLFRSLCPGGKFLGLSEQDEIEVLELLERDDRNIFICFNCRKLWPFDGSHDNDQRTYHQFTCPKRAVYKLETSPCHNDPRSFDDFFGTTVAVAARAFQLPLSIWGLGQGYPEVSFSEAHLVMLNHRHGNEYGLPLHTLEKSLSFSRYINVNDMSTLESHFPLERHASGPRGYPIRPTTVWNFEHQYSAKVINDELFLSRSHIITGPDVTPLQFANLLEKNPAPYMPSF